MARTPSNMLPLQTIAPTFELYNPLTNSTISSEHLYGKKVTVVMFICNHCPFVIHLQKGISQIAADYVSKEVQFIAINSNDVANYPDDSPEKMAELSQHLNWDFPYLYDETQAVAKAFDAACTPDFYVFDQKNTLQYRGQFDDSRPGNGIEVSGIDLRKAINCILEDQKISENQKPSLGCNIKWK